MKTITVVIFIVLASILALSCGQQAEKTGQTAQANDSFIFRDFASAKLAAAESNKYIVLDFYTDW